MAKNENQIEITVNLIEKKQQVEWNSYKFTQDLSNLVTVEYDSKIFNNINRPLLNKDKKEIGYFSCQIQKIPVFISPKENRKQFNKTKEQKLAQVPKIKEE